MQRLLISLCVVGFVLAGRYGDDDDSSEGHGGKNRFALRPEQITIPSFVQNTSSQAQRDYMQIARNQSLTQNQQERQFSTWAQQNGVQSQYRDYQRNRTAEDTQFQQNLTNLLTSLPDMASQIQTVLDNKDLTQQQKNDQVETIRQADPEAAYVVMLAVSILSMKDHQQKGHMNQMGQRGGPMGPMGPMGQMGPMGGPMSMNRGFGGGNGGFNGQGRQGQGFGGDRDFGGDQGFGGNGRFGGNRNNNFNNNNNNNDFGGDMGTDNQDDFRARRSILPNFSNWFSSDNTDANYRNSDQTPGSAGLARNNNNNMNNGMYRDQNYNRNYNGGSGQGYQDYDNYNSNGRSGSAGSAGMNGRNFNNNNNRNFNDY